MTIHYYSFILNKLIYYFKIFRCVFEHFYLTILLFFGILFFKKSCFWTLNFCFSATQCVFASREETHCVLAIVLYHKVSLTHDFIWTYFILHSTAKYFNSVKRTYWLFYSQKYRLSSLNNYTNEKIHVTTWFAPSTNSLFIFFVAKTRKLKFFYWFLLAFSPQPMAVFPPLFTYFFWIFTHW